jgi:hypothetical protein
VASATQPPTTIPARASAAHVGALGPTGAAVRGSGPVLARALYATPDGEKTLLLPTKLSDAKVNALVKRLDLKDADAFADFIKWWGRNERKLY